MPELRSEFLMELRAELDEPLVVADAPLGSRRIMHATRGTFVGPRLTGDLLPGGGDWVLLGPDGVAELDIRFTLRTDDGALIYLTCDGLFDIEPAVRQRIASGEAVEPSEYYFRTVPFFETGAARYCWLNRLLAVGVGRRTASGMVTEVFAIR